MARSRRVCRGIWKEIAAMWVGIVELSGELKKLEGGERGDSGGFRVSSGPGVLCLGGRPPHPPTAGGGNFPPSPKKGRAKENTLKTIIIDG